MDEWLILSKRNFKFDLGDVLLFPSAEPSGVVINKNKKREENEKIFCHLSYSESLTRRFDFERVTNERLPVGLRHMMTGVPDPWLSTLRDGLKAEEARKGWLSWRRGRGEKNSNEHRGRRSSKETSIKNKICLSYDKSVKKSCSHNGKILFVFSQ